MWDKSVETVLRITVSSHLLIFSFAELLWVYTENGFKTPFLYLTAWQQVILCIFAELQEFFLEQFDLRKTGQKREKSGIVWLRISLNVSSVLTCEFKYDIFWGSFNYFVGTAHFLWINLNTVNDNGQCRVIASSLCVHLAAKGVAHSTASMGAAWCSRGPKPVWRVSLEVSLEVMASHF